MRDVLFCLYLSLSATTGYATIPTLAQNNLDDLSITPRPDSVLKKDAPAPQLDVHDLNNIAPPQAGKPQQRAPASDNESLPNRMTSPNPSDTEQHPMPDKQNYKPNEYFAH